MAVCYMYIPYVWPFYDLNNIIKVTTIMFTISTLQCQSKAVVLALIRTMYCGWWGAENMASNADDKDRAK